MKSPVIGFVLNVKRKIWPVRHSVTSAEKKFRSETPYSVYSGLFHRVLYNGSLMTDIGFNRQASEGINRFHHETGAHFVEIFESDSDRRSRLLRMMVNDGVNPVIGVGYGNLSAIREVAAEFPQTRFILIDAVIDLPNVQSVVFKEHEGAFLAGILAGLSSQSKQVGFIGGRDIPPIQRFRCGYSQGVRFASSDIHVIEDMADSFFEPEIGRSLSKKQFIQGVDIIFAAAGTTGEGVLKEAATHQKLAMDSNNAPLISERMKNGIRFARQLIIDGKLVVHDASVDQRCPAPTDSIAILKDR